MSRIGVEVTLELTLRGPILVHSSTIGPWGVDAVAMRDPSGGLIVSGDAVQGKVREAWDEIRETDTTDETLGRQSRAADMNMSADLTDATRREESRARNLAVFDPYPLFFSDFHSLEPFPAPGRQTISQTAVDVNTGTAKPGSLRTCDCPVLPGQLAHFRGDIRFFCDDEGAGQKILHQLCRAFSWVLSFGSQKSVGFGRNVGINGLPEVRVVQQTVTRYPMLATARVIRARPCSLLVDFSFRDSLCVPSGVVNGNVFESRNEIPGEVLRGALARLLQEIGGLPLRSELAEADDSHPFKVLCAQFDRIRFTTARPARPGTSEPVHVPPHSLAIAGDSLFDFALVDEHRAMKLFNGRAAAFFHDWKPKDWGLVNNHLGIVFPRQELRVHTAIETEKRRAKTHNLFAYRLLRPEDLVWRGTVSIDSRARGNRCASAEELQTALNQCLILLQSGWLSVGKTRARGVGTVVSASDQPGSIDPLRWKGNESHKDRLVFVVTLRGPALMIDPRQCVDGDGSMQRLDSINSLYDRYWSEVSGGTLRELPQQRFAQMALVGGFQAHKYRYSPDRRFDLRSIPLGDRRKKQADFPYNPTLTVEAGSVFVLQASDDSQLVSASKRIAEWASHGLPLPEWAAKAYGDTYHTNVFLPENGFGEIDVNLPYHTSTFESPLAAVGGRS